MDQFTTQLDAKLDEIFKRGGTPQFITTGQGGENKIRQELDDKNLMAPNSTSAIFDTPLSPVDEYPLRYKNLIAMEERSKPDGFLSVTFINSKGVQEEL